MPSYNGPRCDQHMRFPAPRPESSQANPEQPMRPRNCIPLCIINRRAMQVSEQLVVGLRISTSTGLDPNRRAAAWAHVCVAADLVPSHTSQANAARMHFSAPLPFSIMHGKRFTSPLTSGRIRAAPPRRLPTERDRGSPECRSKRRFLFLVRFLCCFGCGLKIPAPGITFSFFPLRQCLAGMRPGRSCINWSQLAVNRHQVLCVGTTTLSLIRKLRRIREDRHRHIPFCNDQSHRH
jgi:hypothetical protein